MGSKSKSNRRWSTGYKQSAQRDLIRTRAVDRSIRMLTIWFAKAALRGDESAGDRVEAALDQRLGEVLC